MNRTGEMEARNVGKESGSFGWREVRGKGAECDEEESVVVLWEANQL